MLPLSHQRLHEGDLADSVAVGAAILRGMGGSGRRAAGDDSHLLQALFMLHRAVVTVERVERVQLFAK